MKDPNETRHGHKKIVTFHDQHMSVEEYAAEVRADLIELERRKAASKGRPFDPNNRAMLKRVEFHLDIAMDDMGLFDEERDDELSSPALVLEL